MISVGKNMVILARRLNGFYQRNAGLKHLDILIATKAMTDNLEVMVDWAHPDADYYFQTFSDLWPDDLDWPSDIERPTPKKEAA